MTITLATDMALKRHEAFVEGIITLGKILTATLVMQEHDNRERIVNREGKVISKWENK